MIKNASLKWLPFFLWRIDPGYFRLKQAGKTVLAILLILWLLADSEFSHKLIACLACGFSMQGIVAKSYSARCFQVIVFNGIYCLLFLIGLLLRETSFASIALVMLGFMVNYCRRFGLQTSVAPLMAWTLCFLATILPLDSAKEAWSSMYSLVAGLSVSGLVLLGVFPDNYPKLFINNVNGFFKLLARGMRDIRRYLLIRSEFQAFEREGFVRIRQDLNQLLESNQAMEQSQVFIKQKIRISDNLVHLYALLHAYSLMIDAYRILKIHDYQLPDSMRLKLSAINRHYETLFDSLRMENDYSTRLSMTMMSLTSLSHLTKKLSDDWLSEPTLIMAILNIKLSFQLFNKHINGLLNGCNDA